MASVIEPVLGSEFAGKLWKFILLAWIYPIVYVILVKVGWIHNRETRNLYICCCVIGAALYLILWRLGI